MVLIISAKEVPGVFMGVERSTRGRLEVDMLSEWVIGWMRVWSVDR
jgi:hypothetical protein